MIDFNEVANTAIENVKNTSALNTYLNALKNSGNEDLYNLEYAKQLIIESLHCYHQCLKHELQKHGIEI